MYLKVTNVNRLFLLTPNKIGSKDNVKLLLMDKLYLSLLNPLQEASAAVHQKFLDYQDEVTKEKQLLEKELKETMEELEKLHTKEENVEKLLKHLEQEKKSQAEKLAQMEAKLEGFVENQ